MLALGLAGTRRLKRRSRPAVDPALLELLEECRADLRVARRVTLGVCDHVVTPVVAGALRPLILLPAATICGLGVEQLRMVLLHELAHIRRADVLVNLVQRLVESLLFFHPAVWWLSRRVRLEREHCCDDLVVATLRNAPAYAELIARIAGAEALLPQAAVPMGACQAVLRVRRILAREHGPSRTSLRAGAAVVLMAGSLAAATGLVIALTGETIALSSPYYRFVEEEGTSGRLETAVKTYRGAGGLEISLVAYLEAAEAPYFVRLQQKLNGFERVLHGRNVSGYSGPEPAAGASQEEGGGLSGLLQVSQHVDHYLLTEVLGLVWRGRLLNAPSGRFVDTSPPRPSGDTAVAGTRRTDLELILEDLRTLASYAQTRVELEIDRGAFPWGFLSDAGALLSSHSPRTMKLLAAREMSVLFNAVMARDAFEAAGDPTPLAARNREILTALRREIEAGRKKIGLFYPGYLLPELEQHLRQELGMEAPAVEWLAAWQIGG